MVNQKSILPILINKYNMNAQLQKIDYSPANELTNNERTSVSRNNKSKNRSVKSKQKNIFTVDEKLQTPPNLLTLKTHKNFVIRKIDLTTEIKERQLYKQIDYNDPTTKYYYLGKGNNHQLVKRILDRRKIWVENNDLPLVHFKWVQWSQGVKFHSLNKTTFCFNHFEYHKEITNKQHLIKNLVNFCEANKMNAFEFTPTTFIMDLNDQNISMNMNAFIKFFNHNLPAQMKEEKTNIQKQYLQLPRLKFHHNKNEKRCQGNFYCRPTVTPTFFSATSNYLWLLKPTFLNRGRGIHLFNDLNQLEKLILEYSEGHQQKLPNAKKEQNLELEMKGSKEMEENTGQSVEIIRETKDVQQENTEVNDRINVEEKIDSPQIEKNTDKKIVNKIKACSFVVQKYIQRPFLVNGRKFDIRVWTLVTQNLEVYFFKEGYIRTSCEQYNPKDLSNIYIHLTNNAIQKHSDKYQKYQFGNQLSFTQLEQLLQQQGYFKFKQKILKRMKQIIWTSMCAVKRRLNENQRKYCFQIFGYDFLIDERMKVWLIQVNTNPCIEESSPLLASLIPRMLDDAYKLTLDKMFPPPDQIVGPTVEGYPDNENMFELLGDFVGANKNTLKKRFTFVRR